MVIRRPTGLDQFGRSVAFEGDGGPGGRPCTAVQPHAAVYRLKEEKNFKNGNYLF